MLNFNLSSEIRVYMRRSLLVVALCSTGIAMAEAMGASELTTGLAEFGMITAAVALAVETVGNYGNPTSGSEPARDSASSGQKAANE